MGIPINANPIPVKNYPKPKVGDKILKVSTWNIRRGTIKRELEIKHLLQEEKIDVIFLTETDVLLQSDNEYQIEGFKTVLPIKSNHEDKTRIICLIKNEWMSKCTIRNELMTSDFASISRIVLTIQVK